MLEEEKETFFYVYKNTFENLNIEVKDFQNEEYKEEEKIELSDSKFDESKEENNGKISILPKSKKCKYNVFSREFKKRIIKEVNTY